MREGDCRSDSQATDRDKRLNAAGATVREIAKNLQSSGLETEVIEIYDNSE